MANATILKPPVKDIYIDYFRTQELLEYVAALLPLKNSQNESKSRSEIALIAETIRARAKNINLNSKLFEHFLNITLEGLIKGKKFKALENHLSSHANMIRQKIYSCPNSLNKAYDALRALIEVGNQESDQEYDAFVLLAEEITREIIDREINKWKSDAKRHDDQAKCFPNPQSDIFWIGADLRKEIDAISRYRFREYFKFAEFEPAFAEVEYEFEGDIGGVAQEITRETRNIHGCVDLRFYAYDIWLASRSWRLCNRIRGSISLALTAITALQAPEGWWTYTNVSISSGEQNEYFPSIYITILCCLDLLKLSLQDSQIRSGVLGAKWLLSKQNADGSWSRENYSKKEIQYEPDIFSTILAVEVLIRSGIENVGHSVNMAIQWLMKQQNDFGVWNEESFPFPFLTVLILELLRLKDRYQNNLSHYQSVSRGFIIRSAELVLEDNANSRRLACFLQVGIPHFCKIFSPAPVGKIKLT